MIIVKKKKKRDLLNEQQDDLDSRTIPTPQVHNFSRLIVKYWTVAGRINN